MIFLLSPAKSLDFDTPVSIRDCTQPDFLEQSAELIGILRTLSPAEVGTLMGISDSLAVLNAGRFSAWSLPFSLKNARQAVLAFNGDVYEGLDAGSLSREDLRFAQKQVRILSGLYGCLRPLDLIQAYRLELGLPLKTPHGKNLYAFWGERITDALNAALKAQAAKAVINLASDEYFKAVRTSRLELPVIQPVFEDWNGGRYKVVSFYAKRARGLMARFAITGRLVDPQGLQDFSAEGYAYDPAASEARRWVFRRKLQ
jgi:uncharacterized protein